MKKFYLPSKKHLFVSPFILINALGVTGIIATFIILRNLITVTQRFFSRFQWDFYLTFIILGTVFFNYFITGPEIRRHFSILSSLIVIIFVIKNISMEKIIHSVIWKYAMALGMVMAFSLNIYAVYRYTGKDHNVLNLDINYKDYFCLNNIVKEKYYNTPVLAARNEKLGIRFPIIMEVATSYSSALDTYVHSKVSGDINTLSNTLSNFDDIFIHSRKPKEDQNKSIEQISKQYLQLANELGYKHILWGPIEEKTWKLIKKEQVVKRGNLLETCGTVQLYQLQ